MARRAPKNPINDIVNQVGGWLGGNRGTVQSSGAGAAWQASARSAAQGATRRVLAAGEEVLVQTAAWGGGISSQTARDLMYDRPGALGRGAREAAVSQVTGLVAGAAVGKAASTGLTALQKAGVPARVMNKVRGQTVFVHGTGNPLEGTSLRPVGGSPGSPNEAVVFGWNPRAKGAKDTVPVNVQEYAAKTWNFSGVPEHNVVIGTAPRRAVTAVEGNPAVLKSTKPVEIKAVVKANTDYETYIKNLNRELRKAGAPLRGESRFGPMGDRVERIRRERQLRRGDRGSPV